LFRTKSTGSGSDPESQAGKADSQTAMVDGFGVETGREQRRRGQVRIGFVAEQCFKFGVKELWRDRGEVLMSSYYYNRMNQIVVAVLAGVYSERAGQLWL